MPSRKAGNLIERRKAPSARSQPGRSGSAASTWSSVNTAMPSTYRRKDGRRTRSANRHPTEFSTRMVDMRDPVGVDSTDDGPKWLQSAQVMVGGGLLVALLVILAVSVI